MVTRPGFQLEYDRMVGPKPLAHQDYPVSFISLVLTSGLRRLYPLRLHPGGKDRRPGPNE